VVLQVQEGLLTTSSLRVLVATAVPAERDAVARAFTSDSRVRCHRRRGGSRRCRRRYGHALAGTPYDLVVSAGIAGGFQPEAPVGSLVIADEITVADLGAETPDGFVPVTELGFGTVTHRPPSALVRDLAAATGARTGAVLTVSTVTGTAARATELRARHPRALAEAMEGFGVAEAAAAHGIPVLELRAVSNPVGPRDRAAWRIGDALAALTEGFGKCAPVLESWRQV
jgi:futalosine hydrolase